ncbi:universal stress protein [Novosphingobium sp. G106]|uniref:universal stress protein n=1 Tax=Novosphingobium sp. G106 TaxID=2849500 RepID=UPI001C2D0F41|nr:universal stress protein [Novosphingobium sp. G106]MBV1691938.1 universal stress protein [Novosphingobium sp. G106]
MKSVLLHVGDDPAMDARLRAAVSVARLFGASLSCYQAAPAANLIAQQSYFGLWPASPRQRLGELHWQAEQRRALVRKQLEASGFMPSWLDRQCDATLALVDLGQLVDLVVVGLTNGPGGHEMRSLVADVATAIPSAVLAIPEGTGDFDCAGAAVVAWDGSPAASHALRASRPLLQKARSVEVVTVIRDGIRVSAERPTAYLVAHGVIPFTSEWQADGHGVSDVLQSIVASIEGDYLVLGAYGHARLREAAFGGVTRELLEAASFPMLFAH